ncbi:MAG: molybdopterin molybdenumtransferase MoeA [Gammaproteobacteria bacterium]|nr:MAG: molybdopterin molybdenumtransferase MoeA [Gammaproteobacteria bacterium]
MNDLLDLDSTLTLMLAALTPLATVEETLEAAAGRYLAASVSAAQTVPPFDNSAMDGYAVAAEDPELLRSGSLRIAQRIYAGAKPGPALSRGTCARIFTGAPLPEGANAVIVQEEATVAADDRVTFHTRPERGDCVRPAGGDVKLGQIIAQAGDALHPGRLALLTAAGHHRIRVHRQPQVVVLTTGDELRQPGSPLEPGQIYDSNGPMLAALARQAGAQVIRTARVGDEPDALRQALTAAAKDGDAIICSGGVSVGDADHVRDILAEEGEVTFWRLALKPGKPFAFGTLGAKPFFGLPGNPVSALVTFLLLVRPGILRLAGARDTATSRLPALLVGPVSKRPGRRDFQRGRFHIGADGRLWVEAFARQDSNILSTLSDGNCLIDLPKDSGDLDAGSYIHIVPLFEANG